MSDDGKVISIGRKREKSTEKTAEPKKETISCAFCGRPNTQVLKMIKGPGINICSECVMICVQYLIMEDKIPSEATRQILDAFWGGAKNNDK